MKKYHLLMKYQIIKGCLQGFVLSFQVSFLMHMAAAYLFTSFYWGSTSLFWACVCRYFGLSPTSTPTSSDHQTYG